MLREEEMIQGYQSLCYSLGRTEANLIQPKGGMEYPALRRMYTHLCMRKMHDPDAVSDVIIDYNNFFFGFVRKKNER